MLAKVNFYGSNDVTLGRYMIQCWKHLLKSGKCLDMKTKNSTTFNFVILYLLNSIGSLDRAPEKQKVIVNFKINSRVSSRNQPASSELSLA